MDAKALSLTLPLETFNYLALLATLGKLGRTENEVADPHSCARGLRHDRARLHERRIPAPEGKGG